MAVISSVKSIITSTGKVTEISVILTQQPHHYSCTPKVLAEYFEYIVPFHWSHLAQGWGWGAGGRTDGGSSCKRCDTEQMPERERYGQSGSEKGHSGIYTRIQES